MSCFRRALFCQQGIRTAVESECNDAPIVMSVTPCKSLRIDCWMRASVAKSTEAVAWKGSGSWRRSVTCAGPSDKGKNEPHPIGRSWSAERDLARARRAAAGPATDSRRQPERWAGRLQESACGEIPVQEDRTYADLGGEGQVVRSAGTVVGGSLASEARRLEHFKQDLVLMLVVRVEVAAQ